MINSQFTSNSSNSNGHDIQANNLVSNTISSSPASVTIESPSNSFTVSQGNFNNANTELISGLTTLCAPQSCSNALGDDGILSPEFKQRLWSLFRQIETEFEREFKKMYSETYAIHDRNEKLESSDHEESHFAKKISGSHLSQKIKQQYKQSKQSTSRLVSTFRDRGSTMPNINSQSNPGSNRHACLLCWRVNDHRDGVWEVNCVGRGLVGTACADEVVRLWNADNGHCSLVYLGHSGSVNSVRFKNGLMLTASGDGTAHLVHLPPDKVCEALSTVEAAKPSVTDNSPGGGHQDDESAPDDCSTHCSVGKRSVTSPGIDDSPGDLGSQENVPLVLRHPSSMYQTASLYSSFGAYTYKDSAPLSAADFLLNRDQLVTASWDRLGRIYDIATGSEVASLTGHDLPLTDVRTNPVTDHALAVTASRDSTFRLWDFRCSTTEVHVQQSHNGIVSSVSFVGNSSEKLVSAGADRACKLWDLRNSRNPLHVIRTDSPINRLAVHPQGKLVALPMDNRSVKIFDLNLGTRVARLPRNHNQSHSRIVTSIAWTVDGGGKPNFYSAGFDQQLMAWHLHVPASGGVVCSS